MLQTIAAPMEKVCAGTKDVIWRWPHSSWWINKIQLFWNKSHYFIVRPRTWARMWGTWLFFEAKTGPLAENFGKHCCRRFGTAWRYKLKVSKYASGNEYFDAWR
jgi:hypothetical protein